MSLPAITPCGCPPGPSRRSVFLTLLVQLLSLIVAALFNVLPRRLRSSAPPTPSPLPPQHSDRQCGCVAAAPTPINDVSDLLRMVRDQSPPLDPR